VALRFLLLLAGGGGGGGVLLVVKPVSSGWRSRKSAPSTAPLATCCPMT